MLVKYQLCYNKRHKPWKLRALAFCCIAHKRLSTISNINVFNAFITSKIMCYIPDITQKEEQILNVLRKNGNDLKYIEKQTENMSYVAIMQNIESLQHVKKQTNFICSKAIERDALALRHIREKTDELCLKAIKRNGFAISFLADPTDEMCLEAIKQNWEVIFVIENPTDNLLLEATNQIGWKLLHPTKQTKRERLTTIIDEIHFNENQKNDFSYVTLCGFYIFQISIRLCQ